jgi:primary-amine oxidase
LRAEKEARRDVNPATRRTWKVLNPDRPTALGHFPAYVLEPGANTVPYFGPGTALGQRAAFAGHPVWVTRYRATERYAAGPYPNQHPGGDGLPRWAGDESIQGQDVVLWYTFGMTHTPRPEEWPVMPAAHAGFKLVPEGFFTRNPALDLPR